MNPQRYVRLALTLILLIVSFDPAIAKDKGEELYKDTLGLYRSLAADPNKAGDVRIWETLAKAFYSIYRDYPESSKAPNTLFLSAKMYEEMGERFNSQEGYEKALEYAEMFVIQYPDSNLTDDSQIRIARIIEKDSKKQAYTEYEKVITEYPQGDMVPVAKNKVKELELFKPKDSERNEIARKTKKSKRSNKSSRGGLVNINKIRHWSTDNYTRVVIHVDEKMDYKPYFLKADPKNGKPPRLYVDIPGTKVDKNMYLQPITNGLLEDIKFARNTADTVRVVLYINSFENYKVFSLNDPYRIVMDIHGNPDKTGDLYAKQRKGKRTSTLPGLPDDEVENLRTALGLKINTIVIDPGHGGHDPGAIGPSGLKEKDVALKIAKALKKKLEKDGKQFGVEKVYLTRENDRFIPLEERTGIARKLGADLFISIHCNAAKSKHAHGIETYILSFTNDKRALAVAARENATTQRSLSDMKDIVKQYLLSSKLEESERFANHVQGSVVRNVSDHYDSVKNKGVKKAPFVVLIGADIPSILVETSFISNPREEKRLKESKYIDEIAAGIFSGVKYYSSEVKTAYLSD